MHGLSHHQPARPTGTAALVAGTELVFGTWAAFRAAFVAGSAALSAAWAAFSAVYTAGGAVVAALPAVFGAVWAAGSAVASAAWVGFVAIWQVGQATITAGIAIMQAAIAALPLAVVGLIGYWLAFTDSGKQAVSDLAGKVTQWFGEAFDNVKEAWGGISSALKRGDLEGAFEIGVAAIKVEWARATIYLTEAWNKFKKVFVEGWRDAALKFTNIWASAVHGTAGLLTDFAELTGVYSEKEAEDIRKIMAEDAVAERKERINKSIREQAAADSARTNDLAGAKADLSKMEQVQKDALLKNAFREAFAMMGKDGAGDNAGGKPGNDILGALVNSRSTYGGSASLGFFGGAGTPFKGLEDKAGETNKLLKGIRDDLAKFGTVQMPNGDLVFVGGK